METPLLSVESLSTLFHTRDGLVTAVDGVSFSVNAGETVGIVGESGCGKSVTAKSIMRLIRPPGEIVAGRAVFAGRDLLALSERAMQGIRGNDIAMIFQEPMSSLNPVYSVGFQLTEAIRAHQQVAPAAAQLRALDMLRKVGISAPEERMRAYPHQLSGGMSQRVMIAMGLACSPKLLIADEPTTALDVTVQAQILELMKEMRKASHSAILLITHDLGVVADMCDRVVVMYAGRVVEQASVWTIFARPRHPYTEGLLHSIPMLGEKRERLNTITGRPPNPLQPRSGCLFQPRCPYAVERCRHEVPTLRDLDGVQVACHRAEEIETSGVA